MNESYVLDYPLDENGGIALQIAATPGGVTLQLHSPSGQESPLVGNLSALMSFEAKGYWRVNGGGPTWTFQPRPHGVPLVFKINGQEFGRFDLDTGKVINPPRKLTVFETRIIGRGPQKEAPYPHPEGVLAPLTDLHTHLSAQVAGRDLIALGLKADTLYPTAALDALGISYPTENPASIPKRVFLPLAHLQRKEDTEERAVHLSCLAPEALATLEKALSYAPDEQSSFEQAEKCYYFREPFTKNLELLPGVLRAIAEGYQREGIAYAELSSNAVLDPAWLKAIHEFLPQIEKDTGVALRFLAGLPRNLSDGDSAVRIEQIKRIAPSPYVVGVDVLGYETNKTSHMERHLRDMAQWMRDEAPDMTLRIHAGENSKNPANVKEALMLAKEYGIRLRIGHALHGLDAETLALARELGEKNQLIIESCPDSNLACNHIDFASDASVGEFLEARVPCVLSSDGADFYRTSARQTALAGGFCGVGGEGFAAIRATEERHIGQQQEFFARKAVALPENFLETLTPLPPTPQTAEKKPESDPVPQELYDTRLPLLVAGAAGTSWDNIPSADRKEAVIGLTLLLQYLDPQKIYFVTGRTKDRGIGIELGKAVAGHNGAHGKDEQFACVKMVSESPDEPIVRDKGISHTVALKEPRVFLTDAICGHMEKYRGAALFIGGRLFTRNFILDAQKRGIPYGLMDGMPGASSEKTRVYPQNAFKSAIGMVEYAYSMMPELFAHRPYPASLKQEYERLAGKGKGAARG